MSNEPLMWSEKHRPRKLSQLCDQREAVRSLESLLEKPFEIPHLLLSGPPGSGKTTVAMIVARTLLGDYMNNYTLVLNASDERRLEDVRQKIKIFASYLGSEVKVPFKMVILDEADAMTSDAQTALRRIMENSSATTRFILTCNYSSDIIEPIQSRCALFRFGRIPEKDMMAYLKTICEKENVDCDKEGLQMICDYSRGDVRHAINILQAVSSIGEINIANVRTVTGLSAESKVAESVKYALTGDFSKAREIMIDCIRIQGIPERDFLRYAFSSLADSKHHREVVEIFAKYDSRMTMGITPEIQLSALLAELSLLSDRKERPSKAS